jgi:hypothetical protein
LPALPEKLLTPEEDELARKKASLAGLEAQLADRELELASFRADLVHFEKRYLQTVGRRYAILDDLKAKIAEARARQNPHNGCPRDGAAGRIMGAFAKSGVRKMPATKGKTGGDTRNGPVKREAEL